MDTHNHHHSTETVEPPAPDGQAMTHRGDLADPGDIDHQAMTEAEHAAMGHGAHAGHDKHAGHNVEMFRRRFWLSSAALGPGGRDQPRWSWTGSATRSTSPASSWIGPVLGSVVFFWGGWPFLEGGWDECATGSRG